MARSSVEALYERQIRPLPRADRQLLLAMVECDLEFAPALNPPVRSLLELEGLGADVWQGIDPQDYVRELRTEWSERP